VSDPPTNVSRFKSLDTREEWDPKMLAEMRERFEDALRTADRIVFFALERGPSGNLVVTSTADVRGDQASHRTRWFEALGFMQAKLNEWMRQMVEGMG
jgi:hypothetical protein